MSSIIRMSDGTSHVLRAPAFKIAEEVNCARGSNKLVAFENQKTPTGQMSWLDPDKVISVVDER